MLMLMLIRLQRGAIINQPICPSAHPPSSPAAPKLGEGKKLSPPFRLFRFGSDAKPAPLPTSIEPSLTATCTGAQESISNMTLLMHCTAGERTKFTWGNVS
jgi:hypothetical protein